MYRERMKKIFAMFIACFISIANLSAFAQQWSWWWYWDEPLEILENVKNKANNKIKFQETALDDITDKEWAFQSQYKISNTLDYLRVNIAPYLQWAVYIWLVVAVILIIYNWFLMVTHTIHSDWDFEKVKKRIWYIAIWILLLTWFYAIIKLVVWIINSVFWTGPWWDTGF